MSTALPGSGTINEAEALVNGVDAACGPTAAYIAAGIVNKFSLTQAGLQQIVADALNAGTLNTGGQAFSTGPQWDLAQYGIPSMVSSPANATQLQSSLDNALSGGKPVVLGLSNANRLTNESPGLQGHFVTVVGKDSANGDYIVSDPNLGEFTNNTLGQLFASQPVSVTIPNRGTTGINAPVNVTSGAATNGSGLSLFSVQLPDLSADIENAFSTIFPFTKQANWIINFIVRLGFGIFGGVIFIVSFDYFLGSFKPIQTNQGPIQRAIRDAISRGNDAREALENQAKEAAKVGAEAAVVA